MSLVMRSVADAPVSSLTAVITGAVTLVSIRMAWRQAPYSRLGRYYCLNVR